MVRELTSRSLIVLLLIAVILLASCNMPAPESPPRDLSGTAIAETLSVSLTQTAAPKAPTKLPPSITASLPPTATLTSPTATVTQTPVDADCNKVSFVDDVTISDGTKIEPGSSFTKIWRLRNDGDCTWSTEYALVFVDGDRMGGSEEIFLPANVEPGSMIDLSVDLVAPDTHGTFRGNWRLRDSSGNIFGIGEEADVSFWVEILVANIVDDLELGAATWRDDFDGYIYWYLLDTDESLFEVENGQLVMENFNAGGFEEWGLSSRPPATDFYLEVTAKTGDTCSGLDRYGVLFRASDPDRTYVFGFACNGSYRLYIWDDGDYTGLVNWTSSPEILKGPDQTNRMGVMAEGDTIKLYANGELLTTLTDDKYDEGRFGLFIGSGETDNFKVYVEEVSYWDLSE